MQLAQSEMCWIAKYTLDFKDLVLKKKKKKVVVLIYLVI